MQSHNRKIPISYHAEYQNQVILLRTGKIDPSKTALEEVGFNQNLGFHQNDHKNHDHQVAMCTLAFLELVNEGNIQAQVVAIIRLSFLSPSPTLLFFNIIVLAIIITTIPSNLTKMMSTDPLLNRSKEQ